MPLVPNNTSTMSYSVQCYGGAGQVLEIRLGYFSRVISAAGVPRRYEILHETPSTPMAASAFPAPLRELEDPLLCEAYVSQLLSSFGLPAAASTAVGRDITSAVLHLATAGNYDAGFHIVANVDYMQKMLVHCEVM